MMLPLRRLSSHLRRAVSTSACADALLPLRRLPGHPRRSLSTAASPPPWAMIYRLSATPNSTGGASFSLVQAPSATLFSLPERAYSLEKKPNPDRRYINFHGSVVFAASDGLLLLKSSRHRISIDTKMDLPREELAKEVVEEEHVRYVCNPVSGQLVRLPDYLGMEKILHTAPGLLTQADGGHGPPERYAVVELHELEEGSLVFFQFSSETGRWDPTVHPSPLQPGRKLCLNHEVLAFGGLLWWVDVTCGAVSMDPFSDHPELRYIKLPAESIIPRQSHEQICDLIRYRRMGVSNDNLWYVEVSEEAPFQIKLFMLEDESGCWTLQHQVSVDALWHNGGYGEKGKPLIGAIDPLNADLLYLNMRGEAIISVDMRRKRIIDQCSLSTTGIQPCYCRSNDFVTCLLPPYLGSSRIPEWDLEEGRPQVLHCNSPGLMT